MKTFLAGPAAAGLLALAVPAARAADDPAPDDGTGAAFTACVREHGVEDFPAATVTDNGRVVLDGTGIDPWSDAYRAALDACESELPSGTHLPDDPTPPAPEAPPSPAAVDNPTPPPTPEGSNLPPTAPTAPTPPTPEPPEAPAAD